MKLTEPQSQVFLCNSRFRVLVAGRRFGKTFLAIPELTRMAWGPDKIAWYVAPTYKQAKMTTWEPLKKATKDWWSAKPNETELSVKLVTGGTIRLHGADSYDSLRGPGLNGLVLDEFADIGPKAWTEVFRPMLADRMGRAIFIGTPKGFNHFKDLYENARTTPDWDAFQFTTEQGGNVTVEEIEASRRDMDEKTFRQEFQASFENLQSGRVYYSFDRAHNILDQPYIPTGEIWWSMDFNVNPMCSVLAQVTDYTTHSDIMSGRKRLGVNIFDEICLPDSNIPESCAEFVRRTEQYTSRGVLTVHIFGDPAGSARTHAGKTDYQLIREFFIRDGRYRLEFHVPHGHPPVKDRINSMNAGLLNAAGERAVNVGPRCKSLIRDLEQVVWKADSNGNATGEIDKGNQALTHVSDGMGYLIHGVMGLHQKGAFRSEFIG